MFYLYSRRFELLRPWLLILWALVDQNSSLQLPLTVTLYCWPFCFCFNPFLLLFHLFLLRSSACNDACQLSPFRRWTMLWLDLECPNDGLEDVDCWEKERKIKWEIEQECKKIRNMVLLRIISISLAWQCNRDEMQFILMHAFV